MIVKIRVAGVAYEFEWSPASREVYLPGLIPFTAANLAEAKAIVTRLINGETVELHSTFYTACAWYLLCTNEATATRSHPILGQVPICDRCNTKADAIAAGV